MSQDGRSTAGLFATARRGGLTNAEIFEIEAHRKRERPTPWQALAQRYGLSEIDLRAAFEPRTSPAPEPEPEPVPERDPKRLGKKAFYDEPLHITLYQLAAEKVISRHEAARRIGCDVKAVGRGIVRHGFIQSHPDMRP